ncbi:MAG: hypothetical protein M1486_06020 [Gammaproteobacteria bacterium]|nr:hypothetical protein [Gammaproteobacteria bacterium]
MKQARLLELQKESERFKLDYQNCIQQLDHAQNDLSIAKTAHDQALSALQRKNQSRDQLVKDRNDAITSLQNLRAEVGKHKELMHELEMRIQTSHSQKAGLEQNCARLEKQQAAIEARNQEINHQLANMQPIENIENNLKKYLAEHQASDVAVNKARLKVESLEQELKTLESTRQGFEKSLSQYRAQLENLRVDLQGWKVRSDAISEQIKEINFQLDDVLKTVPEDAVAEVWQTKVEQINNRINRLGPINLIAIEEYATCEERKQYIINQIEDLEAGLQTLEDAIAKIDKETKAKFKETFDKVNARFQELFPTVFGGGKAILELNSEDLLTAGVTMMACPPGKRNSSIHLLSGGEKSLTAIALIFSIFHLNPAPFCLLDEVDAALDDANVLRFTRLVKAMADKTQFLFISHNKMSIEMGEYLIGVTMNEPGVSRLVSVDIEKAMSLAEAS